MRTSRPFHLPVLTPTLGHPWLGTPHHTVSWGLVGSPSAPAPLVSMGRYMRRPLSHRPPPGLPPCPQPQPAMSLALGEWAQESAPRPAVPSQRSASCPPMDLLSTRAFVALCFLLRPPRPGREGPRGFAVWQGLGSIEGEAWLPPLPPVSCLLTQSLWAGSGGPGQSREQRARRACVLNCFLPWAAPPVCPAGQAALRAPGRGARSKLGTDRALHWEGLGWLLGPRAGRRSPGAAAPTPALPPAAGSRSPVGAGSS